MIVVSGGFSIRTPESMCLNDFRLRAQPIRAPPDGCSRVQRPLATGGGTNIDLVT